MQTLVDAAAYLGYGEHANIASCHTSKPSSSAASYSSSICEKKGQHTQRHAVVHGQTRTDMAAASGFSRCQLLCRVFNQYRSTRYPQRSMCTIIVCCAVPCRAERAVFCHAMAMHAVLCRVCRVCPAPCTAVKFICACCLMLPSAATHTWYSPPPQMRIIFMLASTADCSSSRTPLTVTAVLSTWNGIRFAPIAYNGMPLTLKKKLSPSCCCCWCWWLCPCPDGCEASEPLCGRCCRSSCCCVCCC